MIALSSTELDTDACKDAGDMELRYGIEQRRKYNKI